MEFTEYSLSQKNLLVVLVVVAKLKRKESLMNIFTILSLLVVRLVVAK
jgi:hypothetical protein